MARVEFVEDFDYIPSLAPRSLVAYKRGMVETVRRECADQAIGQGKAVELKPKGKNDDEEVPEPDHHRARKAEP